MTTIKIDSFRNKKACEAVSEDALKALQATAEKFGLTVKRGRGTYSDSALELKFEFATQSADGKPTGKDAQAFLDYAPYIDGIKADDLGRWVTLNGEKKRIVGYRPRASRRPVIVEAKDGKQYVCPEETVAAALKREAASA